MSVQGQLLDITVIECKNLKKTNWIGRQNPFLVLTYNGERYRSKTATDGGQDPKFNEKYSLPLIQGLQEINVEVWNNHTITANDFIGSGKIMLQRVLNDGYHDNSWPLNTRSGKRAGEIRVFLQYTCPAKGAHSPLMYPSPAAYAPCPPPAYVPYPPPAYAPYPAQYGAGGYAAPPAFGGPAPPNYGPYPPQPTYPPPVHNPPQAACYGPPPPPPAGQSYPPY